MRREKSAIRAITSRSACWAAPDVAKCPRMLCSDSNTTTVANSTTVTTGNNNNRRKRWLAFIAAYSPFAIVAAVLASVPVEYWPDTQSAPDRAAGTESACLLWVNNPSAPRYSGHGQPQCGCCPGG